MFSTVLSTLIFISLSLVLISLKNLNIIPTIGWHLLQKYIKLLFYEFTTALYSDSLILSFKYLQWVHRHRPHHCHWHPMAWSSSPTLDSHIENFLSCASPSAFIISYSAVRVRVKKGAFWCLFSERIRFVVPRATPGRRKRP